MTSKSAGVLPSKSTTWFVIGLFFLTTFLVYHQSFWNPFVRWDDGLLIYDNPVIRAITPVTIAKIFTSYDPELYIPLTFFSYQLDYAIGGTSPTVYHFTNYVLHTFNALLAVWLFLLLGSKRSIAVICGLLFAVHPLNTEAVVWASARKDVLSIFFGLLSLNFFLIFLQSTKKLWYYCSIFCFILGLFSKVVIAILPAIFCLLYWRNAQLWHQKTAKQLVPFSLASVIFIGIALAGKQAVLASATAWQTLLMATKSTVFYLQKFLVPTGLSVLYPYTAPIQLSSPDFLISSIFTSLLTGILFYSIYKKYTNIALGIGLFLIALVPTFSNFSKGGVFYFASDRYAYFAIIGLLWLLAIGLNILAEKRKSPMYIAIFSTVLICIFSYMSYRQAAVWSSTKSLFQHAIGLYPNSYVAHTNLGNVYNRRNEYTEAIAAYTRALQIEDHDKTRSNYAAVLAKQGKVAEAQHEYTKVLQRNPNSKEAHFGQGLLAAQQHQYEQAIRSYTTALELDPTYAEVHINFGALYMQMGSVELAMEQFDAALAILPYSPQAHYNRAVALRKLKRTKEATTAYENAIALEPSFIAARINLALLYHERRQIDEAIEQFKIVLQYDPENARASSALQQLGAL